MLLCAVQTAGFRTSLNIVRYVRVHSAQRGQNWHILVRGLNNLCKTFVL